jgi:hypothetical protein
MIAELRAGVRDRKIETTFDPTQAVDCDDGRIGQLFFDQTGNAVAGADGKDRRDLITGTDAIHVPDAVSKAGMKCSISEPAHDIRAPTESPAGRPHPGGAR